MLADVVLSRLDDPPDSEDVRALRAFVESVKAGQPDEYDASYRYINKGRECCPHPRPDEK